jgi:hypothetical protein
MTIVCIWQEKMRKFSADECALDGIWANIG